MGRGDLEGYSKTEIAQNMFAFHFVSLVREATATTGCVVCLCLRKKGSEATEKHKHNKELAYSMCLWFQLIGLQGSFPFNSSSTFLF